MNYTHITQGRIYPHPDGKRRRVVLPNFAVPQRGGWVLVKGGAVFGGGPELGDVELFIEEVHPQSRSFFVTGPVRFKRLLHALEKLEPSELPESLKRLGLTPHEIRAFVEEVTTGEQYMPTLPALPEELWEHLLAFARSCSSGRADLDLYRQALRVARDQGIEAACRDILRRAAEWGVAELAETYRAELQAVSFEARETSHGVHMVTVQANGGYPHKYLTAAEEGRWVVVPPRAEPLTATAASASAAADLAVAHFMQARVDSPAGLADELTKIAPAA